MHWYAQVCCAILHISYYTFIVWSGYFCVNVFVMVNFCSSLPFLARLCVSYKSISFIVNAIVCMLCLYPDSCQSLRMTPQRKNQQRWPLVSTTPFWTTRELYCCMVTCDQSLFQGWKEALIWMTRSSSWRSWIPLLSFLNGQKYPCQTQTFLV